MTRNEKQARLYRVELVNSQTVGAYCGYGEGRTLKDARETARDAARSLVTAKGARVRFPSGP